MTTPELEAIRYTSRKISKGPKTGRIENRGKEIDFPTGHKSAASFPTGPVIAEPFISPFGLTIYPQVHH